MRQHVKQGLKVRLDFGVKHRNGLVVDLQVVGDNNPARQVGKGLGRPPLADFVVIAMEFGIGLKKYKSKSR